MSTRAQVRVKLQPLGDGADSALLVSGGIDSFLAAEFAPALLRLLADWSGRSVRVVLPVDHPLPDWFELWTDAFDSVSATDFEIEFALDGATATHAEATS